ncbi:MAG: hypothetical protein CFE21_00080 [Bacteroidetes bacterium B1(2017)]|nr:MAG: hypothetical protein CFE21_00080 [Bacteroidetes bacterium B1(2017)]
MISSDEYSTGGATNVNMLFGSFASYRGNKHYEMSNHLGNVLSVISDKKTAICSTGVFAYFKAEVISATDYSPFGAPLAGRTYQMSEYRFSFNGQERDDEVAGLGNINTAEFWEYDTRLGRRWNLDPVLIPNISPYTCLMNNPFIFADPLGDDVDYKTFGDRINSFFGRIFNKDYRDRFNRWKNDHEKLYIITKWTGAKKRLVDAPAYENLAIFDPKRHNYVVLYNNSMEWGALGIPIKFDNRTYEEEPLFINQKLPSDYEVTLKVQPGSVINMNAYGYPDCFEMNDKDGKPLYAKSSVDPNDHDGNKYIVDLDKEKATYVVPKSESIIKLKVSSHTYWERKDKTISKGSSHSTWCIWYMKQKGFNIDFIFPLLIYPKFKY